MILGLGWLVVRCCPGGLRGAHWAVRLGWTWCLGALALSVVLEWLLLAHVSPRASALLLTLAGTAGIVWAVNKPVGKRGSGRVSRRNLLLALRALFSFPTPDPRSLTSNRSLAHSPTWPLAIALIPVLLAFFSALYRPLDQTDERYNFAIKAKVFFHEGRLQPLTEPWVPHPRYPLLVPLLEVFTSGLAGRFDELAVKPPFAAYFGALVLLFYGEARRHFGPTASGLFTCLLSWLPFWTLSETGMTSAGGDVPVAANLLALLLALRALVVRPSRGGVALAVLLAVALAFTKNEGLALVAFSGLGVLLWMLGRRRLRAAGTGWLVGTAVATVVLLAPWWWMVRQTPADLSGENYLGRLTVENLRSGLTSVPTFLRLFVEEALLRPRCWVLTWWTLPFALFALCSRRVGIAHHQPRRLGGQCPPYPGRSGLIRDPAASLAAVVMACYFVLFILIWMVTPHRPEILAGTALPRLLGQVAPIAWWLILLAASTGARKETIGVPLAACCQC